MPTRLGGHGWRPCVWLCKGQCCRHCHKTYKQKLGFMYGLMVVVERLGHVGISTHTAGKSNTKEDLPRKFSLLQKVQHNLTDLINLCCDTSGPEEKYITETETKNRVSTFMPTRLGGHGWRPCVWLCKGQCCTHGHKTYNQRCIDYMYGLMTVDERLGHVGISTHTAGKSDLPRNLIVSPICSCHFCSVHCVTNA